MIWNDCELIFNAFTGEVIENLTPEQEELYERYRMIWAEDAVSNEERLVMTAYLKSYAAETNPLVASQSQEEWYNSSRIKKDKSFFELHTLENYNVWYDLKDNTCFSMIGQANHPHRDYPTAGWPSNPQSISWLDQRPFHAMPGLFMNDENNGLPYIMSNYKEYLRESRILSNTELIWEDVESIKKFKDKKILIIGAGPSADMVDYNKIDYDYVWSCNHFFNHDKISKLKLDLVYYANDVYHKEEAIQYIRDNKNTICAFDTGVARDKNLLASYKAAFPGRMFLFNTRVFTRTAGIMPRLVCLATLLGAKEVLFAGMDGQTLDDYTTGNSKSIFQEGKRIPPHHRPHPLKWHAHKREFVLFWDHMLFRLTKLATAQSHPMTRFRNLGENYEHNLSADISRQMFPLEENEK